MEYNSVNFKSNIFIISQSTPRCQQHLHIPAQLYQLQSVWFGRKFSVFWLTCTLPAKPILLWPVPQSSTRAGGIHAATTICRAPGEPGRLFKANSRSDSTIWHTLSQSEQISLERVSLAVSNRRSTEGHSEQTVGVIYSRLMIGLVSRKPYSPNMQAYSIVQLSELGFEPYLSHRQLPLSTPGHLPADRTGQQVLLVTTRVHDCFAPIGLQYNRHLHFCSLTNVISNYLGQRAGM